MYKRQLLDDTGNKIKHSMLGMTAGSEWILNGTQIDPSYLRNYVADVYKRQVFCGLPSSFASSAVS